MNRLMINVKCSPHIRALYGESFLTAATQNSAAIDLRANGVGFLDGGMNCAVPTGLFIEMLDIRYCALLLPRSGLGAKGITLANSPALIDPDYRGEIKILLRNEGRKRFEWNPGDRLAQMMFVQWAKPTLNIVEELTPTARGEGGFGSTGT